MVFSPQSRLMFHVKQFWYYFCITLFDIVILVRLIPRRKIIIKMRFKPFLDFDNPRGGLIGKQTIPNTTKWKLNFVVFGMVNDYRLFNIPISHNIKNNMSQTDFGEWWLTPCWLFVLCSRWTEYFNKPFISPPIPPVSASCVARPFACPVIGKGESGIYWSPEKNYCEYIHLFYLLFFYTTL